MNKKFSTLVASILLASSVGAYAQSEFKTPQNTPDVTEWAYNASTRPVVYKTGQAYLFQTEGGEYLSVNNDNKLALVAKATMQGSYTSASSALWVLTKIDAPAGAFAPKYVFQNKYTRAVLAVDTKGAVLLTDLAKGDQVTLGGSQSEWLGAPSYKEGGDYPFYAAVGDDQVFTFAKRGDEVVLVKAMRSDLAAAADADGILEFTPYCFEDGLKGSFVLTPNELNTMLGKAGKDATMESFFKLSFSPEATSEGEANILGQDLQAVAVWQAAQKWGTTEKGDAIVDKDGNFAVDGSGNNLTTNIVKNAYASLLPIVGKDYANLTDVDTRWSKISTEETTAAVGNGDPRWVALRTKDSKYVVVDTAYIKNSTVQGENGLIRFNTDDLYDVRNDKTRRRDFNSYLFRFLYNPSTDKVEIQTKAYIKGGSNSNEFASADGVTADIAAFHTNDYVAKFDLDGSRWTKVVNTTDAKLVQNEYVWRAALVNLNEVTVGDKGNADASLVTAPANDNAFSIKLGSSSEYKLGYKASGAYLIQVTGSATANRVGKYWVNNLAGGFEIVDQATRQNFQHMPAAQWMLKSTDSSVGTPVTIKNREFGDNPTALGYGDYAPLYAVDGSADMFFMNGDTLKFIPVEKANDKLLGYKYVANDTIKESTFTFNYLHELAMDKPINTKDDKDSAVWVDKDGNKMKFVLESILASDDNYGTTNGVSGVADLVRRAYRIKVQDASKLQNDGRYLCYDADLKKYVVSKRDVNVQKDVDSADRFFLKENNSIAEGSCYYTLVRANAVPVVKVNEDGIDNAARIGFMTLDADAVQTILDAQKKSFLYLAEYGKYTSPLDGVVNGTDGWAIKTFNTFSSATTYASTLVNGAVKKVGSAAGEVLGTGVNNEYSGDLWVIQLVSDGSEGYATSKVSVDNNELSLVNGDLSDGANAEVANSAFAVTRDADPLYRYFAAPDTVKIYDVKTTEYLYEKRDKGFNFLGQENKTNLTENAPLYLDTAYVNRGTRMPQYMIAVNPRFVKGTTTPCSVCGQWDCEHSSFTRDTIVARYLVNLQDSVVANKNNANLDMQKKYIHDTKYTRLGFVEAAHVGDSLIISNSVHTGVNKVIVKGQAKTYAGLDTINLANNMHKNAVFSFRIASSGNGDFLIESETEQYNKASKAVEHVANADLESVNIAPINGGWVKLQNGVPVIANNVNYNELGLDAMTYNIETGVTEKPTNNDVVEVTTISVVAGIGNVTIMNAEGKTVAISNILGQSIVNTTITSDNATISVPAGIMVVAVEGEAAVKVSVR